MTVVFEECLYWFIDKLARIAWLINDDLGNGWRM